MASLTFLIRVQVFRDPLSGELPHVQIFVNDEPNPLTWDTQVLSYWFSRNPAFFQDSFVNMINDHCFWSSRTRRSTGGKITTFKLGRPVFYGGIRWCIPVMFLSEWREFPSAPCLAGGEKNLMTARVSMLLKSRASPDMLPFGLCKKKKFAVRHMNRPLFPTTLSIPSYDIGN